MKIEQLRLANELLRRIESQKHALTALGGDPHSFFTPDFVRMVGHEMAMTFRSMMHEHLQHEQDILQRQFKDL